MTHVAWRRMEQKHELPGACRVVLHGERGGMQQDVRAYAVCRALLSDPVKGHHGDDVANHSWTATSPQPLQSSELISVACAANSMTIH